MRERYLSRETGRIYEWVTLRTGERVIESYPVEEAALSHADVLVRREAWETELARDNDETTVIADGTPRYDVLTLPQEGRDG